MSAPTNKPALLLDRVKALEETVSGLAGYVQNEVQQLKNVISNLVLVLNGIIAKNREGFELEVQEYVKDARLGQAKEAADREAKMVASMVEAGLLVAKDTVGEKSILVGREFDTEGALIGAGRSQYRFEQFTDKAKESLLGKGLGAVVEGDNGKFELTEIYEMGEPKAPAVEPAEKSQEVAPAAE